MADENRTQGTKLNPYCPLCGGINGHAPYCMGDKHPDYCHEHGGHLRESPACERALKVPFHE